MFDWMAVLLKTICRSFVTFVVVSLLSRQAHAMNGVWKTTTSFDSEKSQAILSWNFTTTEEVTSVTINKGEEYIVSSLLTSAATPSYKYHVMTKQATGDIQITLTVYNITTLDSGVYRCTLLNVFKDIHLNITAKNGVSKTTTSFDGEKGQAILFWEFDTTENVTSITIKKGEEDIVSSLLTSTAKPSYKYHVMKNQATREIKITLTIYYITTLDSGVYICSLDQLEVHNDIHINITDLMPQLNPVTSTLMQNVTLVWEYDNQHHRHPANKLIFYRHNTKIAQWTSNGGLTPEKDHYRRNPLFTMTTIKDGEIDVITLIIRDTRKSDFNKTYYCNLFSAGRNILTSEIKLVVETMNVVWKTTTSFDSEKSQAMLSWSFNTTENVTSVTITKGEDIIVSSLLTSDITGSNKYHVVKTQTTRGKEITLTVYNITTLDSGVYRCSLDQLDVHKDIHLNITDLMPQLNPVTSTLMQNVKLVWEYDNQHHRYPANKLIFSRQNTKIAEWTSNGGFTPEEDHYRRNPLFTKTTIKYGEIDVITLIIRDTNMFDFNKTYYCKLFSADQNILTSELKLVVEIPEWIHPLRRVTARLGEDATLIWRYKYSFQPQLIFIRQRREISAPVEAVRGYWYGNDFHIDRKYTDMEWLNKTSTGDGQIIQLTLLKTTKDEYNCVYECDIIFEDGQELLLQIKLEKLIVPKWIDPVSSVTAVLGENATFIWRWEYSFQSSTIFISKRRQTSPQLREVFGYWYGNELNGDGPNNDMAIINKTSTGDEGILQLTLLKTTEDEYEWLYECNIIFEDGQDIVSEIKLETLIDLPTIQHYNPTTQKNSEPTAEIPNKARTNTETNIVVIVVYVVISLMVVGLILRVVEYTLGKRLMCQIYCCVSNNDEHINNTPMEAEHAPLNSNDDTDQAGNVEETSPV